MCIRDSSNVYIPSFIKVYEPDIQQGNIIEPEQIERLAEGMPRQQVRGLLGTPALSDLFRERERDVYYYYDKRGKDKPFTHVLTIYYDQQQRVVEIDNRGDDLAKAPSMNSADLSGPAELRETDPTVPTGETAPDGSLPTTPGGL